MSVCKLCKAIQPLQLTVVALTVAEHTAAETRFYGVQMVAERMLELKAAIQQTVVSQEWTDW